MSDPRLVDMEPGGESTQYESIRIYTKTPDKQTGQLGGGEPHTQSQLNSKGVEPDNESTASRDEYADAQRLGMGITKESEEDLEYDTPGDAAAAKSRRQQGYGPGSGVGA
ncbi:uncharacterized protein N7469_001686 [Penicillium citrinum]|uniref:Uncharacterized protein n=2 Tax=Penicillium TaxID=5073 RepID=A0A9W9PH95_PENCI|nr:uncharacterized protein N7469_001686 [Penicillium citrinum]KAJ5243359.1 hypothetical protein N7469_001686 [Penicillium citrinum]KAJ5599134.1 hypothetical protein N7450_000201 [Penicillium hetheringtonii]